MVYDYIRLRVSALFEIHGREHGVGEREQKPARRHEYPLLCKGIVEHRDRADGKGHEQEEGIDADYCSELTELELEQLFADDKWFGNPFWGSCRRRTKSLSMAC